MRRYWPWILLLEMTLVHLFYYPTFHAGFVTDFLGLQSRLDGASFVGVWNCFGFPAMQQVLNILHYFFYELFGAAPLPWYLIHTSLHTINGFLGFVFFQKVLGHAGFKYRVPAALSASVMFLLSPYQTEVVVWKVCLNYLFSTTLILGNLLYVLSWLDKPKTNKLYAAHGLFLLALFTFENAFVVPLLSFVLLGAFRIAGIDRTSFVRLLYSIVLPQLLLLFLRLFSSKLFLGSWVGHYGEAVHFQFVLHDWLGTPFKYAIKFLTFSRYLPSLYENTLLQPFQKPIFTYLTALLTVILPVALCRSFAGKRANFRMSIVFFTFFVIVLLPVANLHFNTLMLVENDRYGYLASLFFFAWLSFVSYSLFKQWGVLPVLVWLICGGYFLRKTNFYWQSSATVCRGLMADFRWLEADNILLLNLPDNMKGIPMFRDLSGNHRAFSSALRYLTNRSVEGTVYEVAQYNLTSAQDGVNAGIEKATGQIEVSFDQWGNWWWYLGQGARNYENDIYRFEHRGQQYILYPKVALDRLTIIYQVGRHWKELQIEHLHQ